MTKLNLTNTQKIALNLIVEDLRFIYSILLFNNSKHTSSFSVALQPYLGLITDGIEQWSRKVKPINNYIPKFTDEEKSYYTEMRNIKLFVLFMLKMIRTFQVYASLLRRN